MSRTNAFTKMPRLTNCATIRDPVSPVAPATNAFKVLPPMTVLFILEDI
jgi:hypothetical protein